MDKFYTFYELFKKKKIIPQKKSLNNKATINNIRRNFNSLKDKKNTEKYGIVLEKKDNKYKVLILKNDYEYMQNLAIYFLKNLSQSFSGYCLGITHSKISLHCDPTINKKNITPKVLCIPKNNSYIKEIELEGNMNIGSILNVGNNKITVPASNKQTGGFAGAFALGIFSGLLFRGLFDVMEMDRQNEENRRRNRSK